MATAEDQYQDVLRHARRIAVFESAVAVLEWDERTALAPAGGEYRAEQLAETAGRLHELRTDSAFGERLESLAESPLAAEPASPEGANVAGLLRDFRRQAKLGDELVRALAKEAARGQQLWEAARAADDFAAFAPQLDKLLRLKREEAEAIGYASEPYDALLDEYEPGETSASLEPVFAQLRDALSRLVQELGDAPGRPDDALLNKAYRTEAQRTLAKSASAAIGYDFARGGLGETSHPFCTTLGPNDIRLATRFQEHDVGDGFFSTIHEAGHGIYEQGLPPEHFGLPTGQAASLGVHESQSRLWENLVARSLGFWRRFTPAWRQAFPESGPEATAEAIFGAVNVVRPSLIRTESDEATYNLHILIRFELEKALLHGDLPVADLPGAWRERYRDLLGVAPTNHADGELQDVHWSAGAIGYFPTYTLGNLYAAQLFTAAEQELGDLEAAFAAGEFTPLRQWLHEKIYRWGRTFSPPELIRRATGAAPSAQPLLDRLSWKYRSLYGLA